MRRRRDTSTCGCGDHSLEGFSQNEVSGRRLEDAVWGAAQRARKAHLVLPSDASPVRVRETVPVVVLAAVLAERSRWTRDRVLDGPDALWLVNWAHSPEGLGVIEAGLELARTD